MAEVILEKVGKTYPNGVKAALAFDQVAALFQGFWQLT